MNLTIRHISTQKFSILDIKNIFIGNKNYLKKT